MAQANDSIAVTAGSGTTVAAHLQNSKKHQVVVIARESGHIEGTEPIYWFNTGSLTHVAAASTLMFDLFNADAAKIVRVRSILHVVLVEAAVTGVGLRWQILATSAVGTGGTALTAWQADTSDATIDTDITARSKATGGATAGASLLWYNRSTEETVGPINLGSPEVMPPLLIPGGIVLRQNQGIRINQESSSSVGSCAIMVGLSVEN